MTVLHSVKPEYLKYKTNTWRQIETLCCSIIVLCAANRVKDDPYYKVIITITADDSFSSLIQLHQK